MHTETVHTNAVRTMRPRIKNAIAAAIIVLFYLAFSLRLPDRACAFVIAYTVLTLLVSLAASWASSRSSFSALQLLGFVVPFGSFFAAGTLLPCACATLLLESQRTAVRRSVSPGDQRWAAPYLFVIGAAVFLTFAYECSLGWLALDQVAGGAIGQAIFFGEWFRAVTLPGWRGIEIAARLMVLVTLFALLHADQSRRRAFGSALVAGLAAALTLSTYQWCNPQSTIFANQSAYWRQLNRLGGSFSDPNAFGVFAALITPLLCAAILCARNRLTRLLWAAGGLWFLILASYSGSRSFFGGLAILSYVLLWRASKGIALVMLLVPIFGVLLINSVPAPVLSAMLAHLPEGLQRTIESMHGATIAEAFYSRSVFLRLAWQAWIEQPLLGVGPGRFAAEVPRLAHDLGIPIGLWRDNPNNFYLGVLAESGLVGALALWLALRGLSWRDSPHALPGSTAPLSWWGEQNAASPPRRPATQLLALRLGLDATGAAKLGIIMLVFLLLVGPHIEFDEVALISALLMSWGLEPRAERAPKVGLLDRHWRPMKFVLAAIVVLLIMISIGERKLGFYDWEQVQGRRFRWTAQRAIGFLPCNEEGRAVLRFSLAQPHLEEYPVIVEVGDRSGRVTQLAVRDFADQHVELLCALQNGSGIFTPARPPRAWYSIATQRPWVPRLSRRGSDLRLLGVKVHS